jgi:hypothetical protein
MPNPFDNLPDPYIDKTKDPVQEAFRNINDVIVGGNNAQRLINAKRLLRTTLKELGYDKDPDALNRIKK